jgi:hypothetical protein
MGPVQISPFATYLDIRLVQIPGMACNSAAFGTQVLTDQRGKTKLPDTYRFVTDFEPSLQQKFSDITKPELVPQSPENSEKNDVSRKLKIVERCA